MHHVILIAHNLRSAQNVGALIRTSEGMGVDKIYLTGYTPYPMIKNDVRLPYMANKIHRRIVKTSLGAEKHIKIDHRKNISSLIANLRKQSYMICALEQSPDAINLLKFTPIDKTALIVGREVGGIEPATLKMVDKILQIPMCGQKESFNVSAAAAMALFYIKCCK